MATISKERLTYITKVLLDIRGGSEKFSKQDVTSWLVERMENSRVIAAGKRGTDRQGWLEDEAYFKAAISLISQP